MVLKAVERSRNSGRRKNPAIPLNRAILMGVPNKNTRKGVRHPRGVYQGTPYTFNCQYFGRMGQSSNGEVILSHFTRASSSHLDMKRLQLVMTDQEMTSNPNPNTTAFADFSNEPRICKHACLVYQAPSSTGFKKRLSLF